MDELRGVLAHDRRAEELAALSIEDALEHALLVAEHPPAGVGVVVGPADDDVALLPAGLVLGHPHAGDGGDRVEPEGERAGELLLEVDVEHVARRHPALLHGGGRESGEADHVARRVDVGDVRLVALVDDDQPALAHLDPGRLEADALGVAAAPRRPQQDLEGPCLAVLEAHSQPVVVERADLLDAVVEEDLDAVVTHGLHEVIAALGVEKAQQGVAGIDEGHLYPDLAEHARVLAPDHPASDHDDRFGDVGQLEETVGVDDARVVEGDVIRLEGGGAGGDQDEARGELGGLTVGGLDADGIAIDDAAAPPDDVDPLAVEVLLDAVVLLVLDPVALGHERVDGEFVTDGRIDPRQWAAAEGRAEQRRLPQRLGGDGAGVDHRPTGMAALLDDRHPVPEVPGLGGRFLTGRTAADADQVVRIHEPVIGTGRAGN